MSMPIIRSSNVCREQAITDLIASVALESAAISHILNAEGEKLQAFVAMDCLNPDTLLEANESVQRTVESVMKMEMALQQKLKMIHCAICNDDDDDDCDRPRPRFRHNKDCNCQ